MRDVDCRRGDEAGVCEPTGYCSFADARCEAGVRRYGALADDELAGTCVPCVAELVAGARHTCARTQAGEVYCWGDSNTGQVGDGSDGRVLAPAKLTTDTLGSALGPARSIAAGTEHTCAVFGDGGLYCWGDNDAGELGNPSMTTAQRRPSSVLDAASASATGTLVAAGLSHSCAVDAGGNMSCWGENSANQLGVSHTTLPSTSAPRLALDAVARPVVGADAYHSCALRRDDSLWCWGGNDDGQVGNGSAQNVSQPVAVLPPGTTRSASIANETSCAITITGEPQCWGANADGQLGDGTTLPRSQPAPVVALADLRAISVGGAHVCAIRRDHTLWCWGRGTDGQLGPGSQASTQPVQVQSAVASVAAGAAHTCVLHLDGVVRCFGANASGQLGNGNTIATAEPAIVSLLCR